MKEVLARMTVLTGEEGMTRAGSGQKEKRPAPRQHAAHCQGQLTVTHSLTNPLTTNHETQPQVTHVEKKAMYLKGNANDTCRPLARSPPAVHWYRGGRRGMVIRSSDGGGEDLDCECTADRLSVDTLH